MTKIFRIPTSTLNKKAYELTAEEALMIWVSQDAKNHEILYFLDTLISQTFSKRRAKVTNHWVMSNLITQIIAEKGELEIIKALKKKIRSFPMYAINFKNFRRLEKCYKKA